jgi:hypothetical protein
MTLDELEKTIADLPPGDLKKFREWFLDFDAKQFDERIERDANSGRLGRLADVAIRQHAAGKSTSL